MRTMFTIARAECDLCSRLHVQNAYYVHDCTCRAQMIVNLRTVVVNRCSTRWLIYFIVVIELSATLLAKF